MVGGGVGATVVVVVVVVVVVWGVRVVVVAVVVGGAVVVTVAIVVRGGPVVVVTVEVVFGDSIVVMAEEIVVVGATSIAPATRGDTATTGSHVSSISSNAATSSLVNASDHRVFTAIQSTAYLHHPLSFGGRHSSGPLSPFD